MLVRSRHLDEPSRVRALLREGANPDAEPGTVNFLTTANVLQPLDRLGKPASV